MSSSESDKLGESAKPTPFAGGGELAARIRGFDWARTSLGPIEAWPQSLKTVTEMLVLSPVLIVLLWGEDGIMIYNDAYSMFAGGRHPKLLGSKVREGWPEVADFNDHVMKVGLAGGILAFKDQELTLLRHGRPEQVWMNLDYSPVVDERGKPAGVIAIVVETTQRVQAERRLANSEQRFRALVNATSDVVYSMSPDWRQMHPMDGRGFLTDMESPSISWMDEYLFPEDRAEVGKFIQDAIDTKSVFQQEHRVRRKDGSAGWTFSRAIPLTDEQGDIIQWFGAASDITERRETNEHLHLVVNELNHRVKNNLAIMQAIAVQTFRNAKDLGEAERSLSARIFALARANDFLTGEEGIGGSLRSVIMQTLEPLHACEPSERCEIDGPEIRLPAKSALFLSLAVHELATNALKYGAWSNSTGVVTVQWRQEVSENGDRLHLEWRERGGPPVAPPGKRGFGSRLIERGLAAEMGGNVTMRFEPPGLVCTIDAPFSPSGD